MTTKTLQFEAQVQKISTQLDGGLKLVIITQELGPEDATLLFGLRGKAGYMIFKATRITPEELIKIPDEIKEFPKDKTSSERLRAAIFVLHQKRNGKPDTFEDFRKKQMEIFIDRIKEEIRKYE